MAAITATNSATPSLQAALGRAKLAQAEREASAAEGKAKQLRSQANEAESQSQERQANVSRVGAEVRSQQNSTYRSGKAGASEVPVKVQNFIESMYRATSQQRADSGNALKTNAEAPPVINTQGQATGRILNLAA